MRLARLLFSALLLSSVAVPASAGQRRLPEGGRVPANDTRPDPSIPEPGALAAFAIGLGLVGLSVRRLRRS